MAFTFDANAAAEYAKLFDTAVIKTDRYPEVDRYIDKIVANRATYEAVGNPLNIPWYFIGIIHCMECGLDFKTHLHNGDPLTARTVQVPAGRPLAGNPPFDWKDSATDALKLKSLDKWPDWSVPAMLYNLEKYNGFGYRNKGINSPYLWSYSNNYTSGKYVADGKYDPAAVSKQCGAGVLLRRLFERQVIPAGTNDRFADIKKLGEEVVYNTGKTPADNALQLQQLLNAAGYALKADGLAGQNTSNAYQLVSGRYLNGDPRRA